MTYETARNTFAVIGLLTVSGLLSLIGWHAFAAARRFRANRPLRLKQRAIAAVKNAPAPSLLGDDSLGDC